MSVSRAGFYKWKNRMINPSPRTKQRNSDINLFISYHNKYPSHGYRWLNAKIRLDLGVVMSDQYAHRCCKMANIKSQSKHYAYKKPGDKARIFNNVVLASLNITAPMQVVVSDMTAFWCRGTYYELTLYMDLWNNEIVSYGLSKRKGDRNSYFEGLEKLIEKKKELDDLELILHTDQGSVYSSKSYNELLPLYNITHSMSRAGTPTDNGAMEAINGWVKIELFIDFHIKESDDVFSTIEKYIDFFNNERPAYSLNYLTPNEYKLKFSK